MQNELLFINVQADEAEATYRTCIADATTQHLELEHTKVTVLRQLQDVIKQSDQTIRSVRAHTHTHSNWNHTTFSPPTVWQKVTKQISFLILSLSTRRLSRTTSSCTCRLWPCRSTTRLCVRAVNCTTQASSTPPMCEICNCQSSRMFNMHLRTTALPVHHHSKRFSQRFLVILLRENVLLINALTYFSLSSVAKSA